MLGGVQVVTHWTGQPMFSWGLVAAGIVSVLSALVPPSWIARATQLPTGKESWINTHDECYRDVTSIHLGTAIRYRRDFELLLVRNIPWILKAWSAVPSTEYVPSLRLGKENSPLGIGRRRRDAGAIPH